VLAYIFEDGAVTKTSNAGDVVKAHGAGRTMWIDLEGKAEDCDRLINDVFKIHPLTVEDIWNEGSMPKIEDFPGYLYVRVHGLGKTVDITELSLLEVDIVIGPTFVLTHDSTRCTVDAIHKELGRSGTRLLARGPAWIAHAILDNLTDRYLPIIDDFDEAIETLELEVVEKAGTPEGKPLLQRIFDLKRSLQSLRRISVHQREVLLRLSRGEFDEVPQEAMPFYRDVFDHFVRVTDLAESYRDLVSASLDAYLSVQSNRMNEVMKTLTLISTIMLPLTFIAGVYGMNFEIMPELKWKYGYAFALGSMALVAGLIVLWFKTRKWL
jgi:magnesium transporter